VSDKILEMKNITKRYPGVVALDNVSFSVKNKTIHALVGENGAGKSTLMKVLSGVITSGNYEGDIYYKNEHCEFKTIKESENLGIAIIHQELALVPYLSIRENIFLGHEHSKFGVNDVYKMREEAIEVLKRVGLSRMPETIVSDLSVAEQQLVEIAKALTKHIELLVLDEPTSALNENESNQLLNLLLEFKKEGLTSILISHKLSEVIKVCDAFTILRDGAVVETLYRGIDEVTEGRIVQGMVGRSFANNYYPPRDSDIGDVVLKVEDWNVFSTAEDKQIIKDVSFDVKRGEVVGIAGLMGAGRTELAMSIFGYREGQKASGKIYKNQELIQNNNISMAVKNGFAYISEDRKVYGLIQMSTIKDNMTLVNLKSVSNNGRINFDKEINEVNTLIEQLVIRCTGHEQVVETLSGGNQQKVALAKWIFSDADIILLDEPTRGIDVGAKYEIFSIINQLAESGKTILMISSELPELLGMCDRIYLMTQGKIIGCVDAEDATQETIMAQLI